MIIIIMIIIIIISSSSSSSSSIIIMYSSSLAHGRNGRLSSFCTTLTCGLDVQIVGR